MLRHHNRRVQLIAFFMIMQAVMQDGVFVEELDAAALRHATARHPHTRELIEASRGYRRAVAPA